MYIKNFYIDEFGPLKDISVEEIPCGMAVFLGNNEAGKSSAMEFVRSMLMGNSPKRNAHTQAIRASKGGTMRIHDAHVGDLEIVRRFSQSSLKILDANGNQCKENVLTDIMGGISREVYRMIFGFNLLELQNMASFHDLEVFNAILGASYGLGLKGPMAAQEEIQKQMDLIFKNRSKNTELQNLFDTWNQNKEQLDVAYEEVKQFDSLQKEMLLVNEQLFGVHENKHGLAEKNAELLRLNDMWSQWKNWADLQNAIKALPTFAMSFPPDAELLLERTLEQEKIKQKTRDELKYRDSELEQEIQTIPKGQITPDQYDSIKRLTEQKGIYRQASTDTNSLEVKQDQVLQALNDVHEKLKKHWAIFDGDKGARSGLDAHGMVKYLSNVVHNNVLVEALQQYEERVKNAEGHVQNVRTAMEYAQQNIAKIEQDYTVAQQKIQTSLGQKPSAEADSVEDLQTSIELAKEAKRLFPEKINYAWEMFSDWKTHVRSFGIMGSLPDEYMQEQLLAQNAEESPPPIAFILQDFKDKTYFATISNVLFGIQDLKASLMQNAGELLHLEDEQIRTKEELQRLVAYEQEFIVQMPHGESENTQVHELAARNNPAQQEAYVQLDNIHNHLLAAGEQLKAIQAQKETLDAETSTKKFGIVPLIPAVSCGLLGLPLLIARLVSGQNMISFDILPSIYVPFWVPFFLLIFSAISFYLALPRREINEESQRRLDEFAKAFSDTVLGINFLQQEDQRIVASNFHINEDEYQLLVEETQKNMNNRGVLPIQKIARSMKELNAPLLFAEKGRTPLESEVNIDLAGGAVVAFGADVANGNFDLSHVLSVLNFQSEFYIVRQKYLNEQDLGTHIQETDQGTDQGNLVREQFEQKILEIRSKINECNELLQLNTDNHEELQQAWAVFFQERFFEFIPHPNSMDAFFLRLETCAKIQERFIDVEQECGEFDFRMHNLQDKITPYVAADAEMNAKLNDKNLARDIYYSTCIQCAEKILHDLRVSVFRSQDNAVEEAALKTAMQAKEQALKHMTELKETLNARRHAVDVVYTEFVRFLCEANILTAKTPQEYVQECINGHIVTEQIALGHVKVLKELIVRFFEWYVQFQALEKNIEELHALMANFEKPITAMLEDFDDRLLTNDVGEPDYIASFDVICRVLEKDSATQEHLRSLLTQRDQLKKEAQAVSDDLEETRNHIQELLDVARVGNETELRDLLHLQKKRDQLIGSSLALEELFYNAHLPLYVEKVNQPIKRAYDAVENKTLPGIFEYFDISSKNILEQEQITTQNQFEVLQKQEADIQNRCGVLQAKCDALIQSDTLAVLKHEQISIEEKIEAIYEKWSELSFAKNVLIKARKQYEQERQPKVIQLASSFFATITDNMWEKIMVSVDDRDIKVVGKSREPIRPELLSQGAQEQLYLALRLAHILNRSADHNSVPILMDDILVNFDAKRMANTMDALSQLMTESKHGGNSQQILFYTCHESTAQLLQEKIPDTKLYLVENKTVRPA